ncbi:MAG: glucosaminidase domain-containing protein [Treponema sp.]|nr:glucosaminidase domain-containing protein [Treponema sp.]
MTGRSVRTRGHAVAQAGRVLAIVLVALSLAGCVTSGGGRGQYSSRSLSEEGVKTEKQLVNFFMANRPDADKKQVKRLARYYISEARMEGINSDCAWVQMCLETGWLKFTGLVKPEMHNYCGLGAISAEQPGVSFATEQLGVRAHIQHLHAYATPDGVPLRNELIDPRYKWVLPRGKAPTVKELAGTWAADPEYGKKLEGLLSRLEKF